MERCEPPARAGSCVLRRPDVARIVQDALRHFEGARYHLLAWTIMPNHVHVVFTPLGAWACHAILHSWKSFTSQQIGKLLGRRGTLWARESFDHVVRSPRDLERFVTYIEQNPVAAGLCADPADWRFSHCGAGFQPASVPWVDPRSTPFAPLKTRGELPHLYKPGCTYFVTFCLYDAVADRSSRTP
jgi:REP element-mobilizing transposase RayT